MKVNGQESSLDARNFNGDAYDKLKMKRTS